MIHKIYGLSIIFVPIKSYKRSREKLKPTRFVHSRMYLQQKNIQRLKLKIREHTKAKMIFKLKFIYLYKLFYINSKIK
jgi:hypothetical protein